MNFPTKKCFAGLWAAIGMAVLLCGAPTIASAKDGAWCEAYEECKRNFDGNGGAVGEVTKLYFCWPQAAGCIDKDKRACKRECRTLKREAKATCDALSGKEKRACNKERRALARSCKRACKE